jgi:pimeloyl-ACP methyl ester carboxylesterase
VEVDGVPIHYVEAGQGKAVLLIHGLGASTFSFRHTIPELAQRYRVIALDLKGFGYSARPQSDYSLTAQAALVRQVMDRLGVERAAVVGHSMGGAVAMRLALGYPERVSRLVLVASATDRELRRLPSSGRPRRPAQCPAGPSPAAPALHGL